MTTIGILVFDDVEELDFVGPLEVFGQAQHLGADCNVLLVGAEEREIRCRYGLRMRPEVGLAACPRLDLLLVPGGPGARTHARQNPAILEFIRRHEGSVASVCTGALVLASAGLLDGRRATTHWSALDLLRATPGVHVEEGMRMVFDGRIASAAGVSAGIDLSLALVERNWGAELAREVAHRIEWDGAGQWQGALSA